mgnify:CR=1 FL=1
MIKKSKNFDDFERNDAESPTPAEFTGGRHGVPTQKRTPRARAIADGYIIPLAILAAVTVVFAASLFILPKVTVYEVGAVSERAAGTADDGGKSDSEIRIFREYNGKVGVFKESGELDFVIDVPVSSLPEYDRTLIASGIIAEGAEGIAAMKEALSP